MAYCRHAHRTTIELADVELLMKRFALELYVYNLDFSFHYPKCVPACLQVAYKVDVT